jgi:hypothetical protein
MISNKKLQINVVTLIIICIALCITSFAIASTIIRYDVQNNSFQTGSIDIDLNGGKPIIDGNDPLFQPGMTVKKEFYIENKGTWEVFYKLYFSKVEGKLGDALKIKIYKENSPHIILLQGTISDLINADELSIVSNLEIGEKQELVAEFYFPPDKGDEYQGETLAFDIDALAVQAKNNDISNPKFE